MQKFVDRLEEAIERGLIDLVDDEDAPRELRFSVQQWSTILAVLLPEEFPAETPEPSPTNDVPGSARKIGVMVARAERREALCSPRDADISRGKYVSAGSGGSGRMRGRMIPKE